MSRSNPSDAKRQQRVLVLAPSVRDAPVLCGVLSGSVSIEVTACDNIADLCRQINENAAAAIIAEEGLTGDGLDRLAGTLAAQPEWSDFPLILMIAAGGEKRDTWQLLRRRELAASLTLLQRPIHKAALVSAVHTALQSRHRQYQVRDELIERGRLTDASPVLIAHVDAQERYQFVNQRYEEWFGVSRDQIIGRTVREILGEEAYQRADPYIRRVLRGEEVEFENHLVLPDGRQRVALTHMVSEPDENGFIAGFYVAKWDITGPKQIEKALRENEQRLRLALEAGQMGLWDWDVRTRRSFWNRQEFELLDMTPSEEPMDAEEFFRRVHPKDLRLIRRQLASLLKRGAEFSHEFRIIRPDGEVRWLRGIGRLYRDESGRPLRMVGVNFDVTSRKTAEEDARQTAAAHALSAGLIQGQEEERKRIALELHDDFAQRIAALAMDLDKFSMESEPLRERIQPFQARIGELCEHMRQLSHQLHPSILDHLGLTIALESECDNLSTLKDFPVHFCSEGAVEDMPKEYKLCLYRIAQEALHNIAKHAEATSAEVLLERDGERVYLLIEDDGIGFDANAIGDETLGLSAMEERLRPFQGTLSIHSQPGSGTRIEVSISMAGEAKASIPTSARGDVN
jgi:PAS domain S-box-containing protein